MVRAILHDLDTLDTEALKTLVIAQHEEKQRQLGIKKRLVTSDTCLSEGI
jgi:hypothetical protein